MKKGAEREAQSAKRKIAVRYVLCAMLSFLAALYLPISAHGQTDPVDSLCAAAHLKAGEADRAVSLLQGVADHRPRDAAIHVALGRAYLAAKDSARAEEAFKKAVSLGKGKELTEAYYGLGLIYTKRHKGLYTAIDYFREVLTRDRDHVDARYQTARARYLLGEYDAKADAEKVLKAHPNYAEAYLLMGDWFANLKEDYAQAIPWYAKYTAMRPGDPEGRRRLSAVYLKVKDYGKILETLLTFVQKHPDAVDLLPIVAQACIKQGKLDMALGFFRAYISKLDSGESALYEDISLIASKEESSDYGRIFGAEREAFLKHFWNRRDPDLSTPVNERLLEHYRRVWYARMEFSGKRQPWDRRGEVYVRFGEPDHRSRSRMMNGAQSLAVQRVKERMALDLYGMDAVGETYVGPVFPVRSISLGGRPRENVAEEIPEIILEEDPMGQALRTDNPYIRVKEPTSGDQNDAGEASSDAPAGAAISPGGQRRSGRDATGFGMLRGSPQMRPYAFGEYRPVVTSGGDVGTVAWESWVYCRIDGGIEITFTDEGANGVYDYAPAPMSSSISADQLTKLSRYAPQGVFERAVSVSSDFYAPGYNVVPLDFFYDMADFQGTNGRSALEVYYGIPRTSARYVEKADVTRLVVERQVALIPAASDTVYRTAGDLVYQAPGRLMGEGAFVPDVVRLEVPPGDYRLEVRARDRLTGRLGLYRKEVQVEAYGREGLRMSDLELAWRIAEGQAGDKFSKGNLRVIPMPTRTYRKGQNVFVYYEVYNLAQDKGGQTSYRVEYTIVPKEGGGISRLVRTFVGRSEKVAVGYEQRGFGESEAAHMELDLGACKPGRYDLRVEVTDLNSGQKTAKEVAFVVVEE